MEGWVQRSLEAWEAKPRADAPRLLLALLCTAIWSGLFVKAPFAASFSKSAAQIAPLRVLWVDQNDPNATDQGNGSLGKPFKTISQAALAVQPGDLVQIRTGIYRENVHVSTSGTVANPIRFQAAPSAHVVVTGSDVIQDALVHEPDADNVFSMPWPYKMLPYGSWPPNLPTDGSGTWPNDDYHKLIGRCEQVIADGILLHQVLEHSQLSRGSFYVDLQNQRLYVWDSSNVDLKGGTATIEASTRPEIWTMQGSHLQVSGLRFRYATNSAQHAAVNLQGNSDLIENCAVERTNGVGLDLQGDDLTVRHCLIRDNGELGFGGTRCNRLLVTDSEIRNNNVKNFSHLWECGNCKLTMSRDTTYANCIFAESHGVGLWFDVGNENTTVRNCLIENNEEAGIFYEISYGLHAEDNVIVGNGFDSALVAHGANGAISLSDSPGCVIQRNLMVGNLAGFQLRESVRTTARIDNPNLEIPIWNHDETLQNNVIAYNLTYQVAYWLDIKDDYREFPLAIRSQIGDVSPVPSGKDKSGQPVGLSLEDLKFRFAHNLYSQNPGEKFCLWGVPWYAHKEYATLDRMRADLKLDTGSVTNTMVFAAPETMDYRVPAASLAVTMKCYPHGKVPGVTLGSLPETRGH